MTRLGWFLGKYNLPVRNESLGKTETNNSGSALSQA